jgi:hypothetical protein
MIAFAWIASNAPPPESPERYAKGEPSQRRSAAHGLPLHHS